MKKMRTLFDFSVEPVKVRDEFEWVMNGEGVATIKYDGSCCAIINGKLYRRYDANGKTITDDMIKCQEHHYEWSRQFPVWRPCVDDPNDKYVVLAYENLDCKADGTYEAVGRHFNNNPYNLDNDILIPHGQNIVEVERTYDGIKRYLDEHYIEGLVFWKDGEPWCKIRRKDFKMGWNDKAHGKGDLYDF